VPPFGELPRPLIEDEITLGAKSIERAGAQTQLLRTPGGSVSQAVLAAAQAAGERVVLWSIDPRDWVAGTTADEIVHTVLSQIKPGSIIDFHDGGGDRTATIEALPRIIRGIRHRHLKLVAIPTG
jgi:peptidoglycan/xylan/chitin deacetylase (PgdA/CDA1 family)